MKYVCKVLCVIVTTIFISSCASPGVGCYDFSNQTDKKELKKENRNIVFNVVGENNLESLPTNCID